MLSTNDQVGTWLYDRSTYWMDSGNVGGGAEGSDVSVEMLFPLRWRWRRAFREESVEISERELNSLNSRFNIVRVEDREAGKGQEMVASWFILQLRLARDLKRSAMWQISSHCKRVSSSARSLTLLNTEPASLSEGSL